MSKAFAEAGKGGGEAADSLKELGITAAELRGKTPDQQFRVLAEAIAHTKDSSVATRAELAFFSREGQKLHTVLAKGAEGLAELGKEAERTGNALSSIENAKIDEANESLRKAHETIEGLENKIVVALSPAISEIAERFTSVLPSADTFAHYITEALHVVAKGVAYVAEGWTLLKVTVLGVSTGIVAAIEGIILITK